MCIHHRLQENLVQAALKKKLIIGASVGVGVLAAVCLIVGLSVYYATHSKERKSP